MDANGGVVAPGSLREFVTTAENWRKTWHGSAYRNRSVGMDRRAVPLLRQIRPYPLRRDGLRLNFKSECPAPQAILKILQKM